MNKEVNEIPVFFAVDNGYIPFLGVALKSLIDNTSKKNKYAIKILYTSVTEENKARIKKYEKENISIEFVDLNKQLEEIKEKLYTRNYFSNTTYYRLFIPELYPQYDKVVYIDSDTICLADIADLYNVDMGDNLIAAVSDGAVQPPTGAYPPVDCRCRQVRRPWHSSHEPVGVAQRSQRRRRHLGRAVQQAARRTNQALLPLPGRPGRGNRLFPGSVGERHADRAGTPQEAQRTGHAGLHFGPSPRWRQDSPLPGLSCQPWRRRLLDVPDPRRGTPSLPRPERTGIAILPVILIPLSGSWTLPASRAPS